MAGSSRRRQTPTATSERFVSFIKKYSDTRFEKLARGPSDDDDVWTEVLMARAGKYIGADARAGMRRALGAQRSDATAGAASDGTTLDGTKRSDDRRSSSPGPPLTFRYTSWLPLAVRVHVTVCQVSQLPVEAMGHEATLLPPASGSSQTSTSASLAAGAALATRSSMAPACTVSLPRSTLP
jgi:hypothetical protein